MNENQIVVYHPNETVRSDLRLEILRLNVKDCSLFRYRGRTWIRIGPRRDIASLDEETMLAERKARHFATFDARPCFQSSLDDLDLDLFLHDYLPKAISPEILSGDKRPVERKLEALRLYNSAYGVPTNAAILLFGKNPRYWFPGAYVQYVNFGGRGKAEFSFRLITAFETKVALAGSGVGEKLPENDPINDGKMSASGITDGTMDGTMALRIVSVIEKEPSVTMDQLSERLSIARRTLVRYMNILQENKRIKRVGGKRFGHWEVVG